MTIDNSAEVSEVDSSPEERFSAWVASAKIGDTFDMYANAPTPGNQGLVNTLTGYTDEGKPILQTSYTQEWQDKANQITDLDVRAKFLVGQISLDYALHLEKEGK